MASKSGRHRRAILIWLALLLAISVPVIAAATSPLLAWRGPIYVLAGFSGIVAMILMLIQPLLAGGYLPGLQPSRGRIVHRWTGALLVFFATVHVAGLWVTSPPDVVDAMLFRSPTPFSAWGVIAMWALLCVALVAASRKRFPLPPLTWRRLHTGFAAVAVLCAVVHALLIEGTMETMSKIVLCGLVVVVTVKTLVDLRVWRIRSRRGMQ